LAYLHLGKVAIYLEVLLYC